MKRGNSMFTRVMRVMLVCAVMMPMLLFAGDQGSKVYAVAGKVTSVDYGQRVIVIKGNNYYIPINARITLEDGAAGDVTDIQIGYTVGCRYRESSGDRNVVESVRRVSADPSYTMPQL